VRRVSAQVIEDWQLYSQLLELQAIQPQSLLLHPYKTIRTPFEWDSFFLYKRPYNGVMNLNQATFTTSAPKLSRCPTESIAEVAFAGRSNAGKSSALNRLTGVNGLARTSKTPGRTQLINYFELDEAHYLVDLPGYGFAKVPLKIRQQWERHLEEYLRDRKALRGLIILMDIRHPMTDNDRQMVEWSHFIDRPIHILLTKADKLKRGAAMASLHKVEATLKTEFPGITVQIFSSTKGIGVDEARQTVMNWLTSD